MSKKIYLSPSNQNGNTYATGGTNEMAQCDKIAAAAAKALKRCGFDVMVAKSGTLMQTRCPESDKFGADIHMPIHTNAFNGKYTGGTRVFCLNSNGRKAAEAVKSALGANLARQGRFSQLQNRSLRNQCAEGFVGIC